MGDSAITIVAIFLAAILMFIFPLMTMADKQDELTSLTVQTATTEFTDNIRTTGVLTQEKYDNYILILASTGNSYEPEITLQRIDENPVKKYGTMTIGDNVYYVMYTTQILDEIKDGAMALKEGDIITVSVKNTNTTIAQQLRNFVFMITGNTSKTIAAESSGMVTTTPNTN